MTRSVTRSSLVGGATLALALALPGGTRAQSLQDLVQNAPWQKAVRDEQAAVAKADAALADGAALDRALSQPTAHTGLLPWNQYYRYRFVEVGTPGEARQLVQQANGPARVNLLGMDLGGFLNLSEDTYGVSGKMNKAYAEAGDDFTTVFDIPEDDQWAAFEERGVTPTKARPLAVNQLKTEITTMKSAASTAKTAMDSTLRKAQEFVDGWARNLSEVAANGIPAWNSSGSLLVSNIQQLFPKITSDNIPGTEKKLADRGQVVEGHLYISYFGVKAPVAGGATANPPQPPPDQTAAADQTRTRVPPGPAGDRTGPLPDQTVRRDQTPTTRRNTPGDAVDPYGMGTDGGTGARPDQTVRADQTPTGARVTPSDRVTADVQANGGYRPGYDPNLNNRMRADNLLQVLLGMQSQLTGANYQNPEWAAVIATLGVGSVLLGHQSGANAGSVTTLPGSGAGGLPTGDVDQTRRGSGGPQADQPGATSGRQPYDATGSMSRDLVNYLSAHVNGNPQQLFAANHKAFAQQMVEQVDRRIKAIRDMMVGISDAQKARIEPELAALERLYAETFRPAWLSVELAPAPVPAQTAQAAHNALKAMHEKATSLARVFTPAA